MAKARSSVASFFAVHGERSDGHPACRRPAAARIWIHHRKIATQRATISAFAQGRGTSLIAYAILPGGAFANLVRSGSNRECPTQARSPRWDGYASRELPARMLTELDKASKAGRGGCAWPARAHLVRGKPTHEIDFFVEVAFGFVTDVAGRLRVRAAAKPAPGVSRRRCGVPPSALRTARSFEARRQCCYLVEGRAGERTWDDAASLAPQCPAPPGARRYFSSQFG